MKKSKSSAAQKIERVLFVISEIERLSEERKKLYEEHDELVKALNKEPNLESKGLRLRRTFEKGNTQWGHGPVREFVFEKVEPKK